jgi:outer membrane protein TolC
MNSLAGFSIPEFVGVKKNEYMMRFGGWRRAACLVALLMVASQAQAEWWKDIATPDWWKDPFAIEQKTSPSPDKPWQPAEPLPAVPVPGDAKRSLATDHPLTLPELTEFALLNNPRSRQAWLNARVAAAAVGVQTGDDFPTITGAWTFLRQRPVSGTTGLIANWINRWGPSISLSYTLYDFGLGDDRLKAAEYRLLAANLAQNRVLQELVFQVEQAYFLLIGTEAIVRVNEQAVKNLETALDAARRRRESGVATIADVYRSETQVAQARLTLTRSRGEYEKARGQLASVVGLSVNSSLQVQPLSAPPQSRQSLKSITEYLDTVKRTRPDLVAAQAQVEAARASASAASKAGLPSIDFLASTQHSRWYQQGMPPPYRPDNQTYAAGVTVRIPLFSGFKDTYQQRQAEAQAQQAEATRDALYRQTQLEVWQAYYDLRTVNGSIDSTEALVKSAEQTAQATLARYQGGFGTILDLITAQQDETSARTQRIQSYLDWYTVLARLHLSVGAGNLLNAAQKK